MKAKAVRGTDLHAFEAIIDVGPSKFVEARNVEIVGLDHYDLTLLPL
jgi:hypothetical protein